MRLFVWTFVFTTMLLIIFAEIISPTTQHSSYVLPIHKTLYLSNDIYDEEMYALLEACIEWHEVTNGQVTFDIEKFNDQNIDYNNSIIVINVTPNYPEIIIKDAQNDKTTLGIFVSSNLPYIAFVESRMINYLYTPVSLHELGHALGLEHITDKTVRAIMSPTIESCSYHISDADLSNFCKLYRCDSSQFHAYAKVQ